MLRVSVRDVGSERLVGVELRRLAIWRELLAPSLLDLGAVGCPQCMAQQLQALEDGQGLLWRPVLRDERRRRRCRW